MVSRSTKALIGQPSERSMLAKRRQTRRLRLVPRYPLTLRRQLYSPAFHHLQLHLPDHGRNVNRSPERTSNPSRTSVYRPGSARHHEGSPFLARSRRNPTQHSASWRSFRLYRRALSHLPGRFLLSTQTWSRGRLVPAIASIPSVFWRPRTVEPISLRAHRCYRLSRSSEARRCEIMDPPACSSFREETHSRAL